MILNVSSIVGGDRVTIADGAGNDRIIDYDSGVDTSTTFNINGKSYHVEENPVTK